MTTCNVCVESSRVARDRNYISVPQSCENTTHQNNLSCAHSPGIYVSAYIYCRWGNTRFNSRILKGRSNQNLPEKWLTTCNDQDRSLIRRNIAKFKVIGYVRTTPGANAAHVRVSQIAPIQTTYLHMVTCSGASLHACMWMRFLIATHGGKLRAPDRDAKSCFRLLQFVLDVADAVRSFITEMSGRKTGEGTTVTSIATRPVNARRTRHHSRNSLRTV